MDVTLAWDANSEAALAGYKIYYKTGIPGPPYSGEGASEGNSPISVTVEELENPNSPHYIIHGLSDTETAYLTLTAFNADGMESGFSNEVSLGATNQPPIASFTADPPSGEAPLLVLFDATESRDPDGVVVFHNWDFGDGTAGSGEILTYEYEFPGTYTVSLTVTDDVGATDSATATATISPVEENQPPVADSNGPYTGTVGELVVFDGSGSFDPDGTIFAYNWDFGDGSTGTGVSPTHAYATDGLFNVSLTVTDDLGATDEAMDTITVSQIGVSTIHIGDLAAGKKIKGKRGLWEVFVTVTVHDEVCNPVAGAKVVGEWSNALRGSASGTTARRGTAKFKTGSIMGGDSVTFTVIEVEHNTFTYDAFGNHKGTTIDIFKN
ncbi:MAG: PKD domain-containing protein [Deltaproteobacteria bacterium]|nr:MAG: PKD domain-containing protein [Deltaproteobacteria bacterium]